MQIIEQMGTKYKFWLSSQDDEKEDLIFKQGRPGTGEDWAEKIACELAKIINLPRAEYNLAKYKEMYGVISKKSIQKLIADLYLGMN